MALYAGEGRAQVTADSRAVSQAGLASVAVGLAVLALKALAAWRTGSLALLADAAESVVAVVATLIGVASVRQGARPESGAAGHGPVEYLSAAIEGALVVLAAFVVAFEALARFGQPPVVPALGTGLALALLATAGNAALARGLTRVARRQRSRELLADAIRLRGGVGASLAVYAGVAIAWFTGYWPLDAGLALAVALHILVAGLRAVRHSVAALMDEALPADEVASIERFLAEQGPPVVEHRDLRTRRAGTQVVVELELVISRYALVGEAHAICDRIEAGIEDRFPGARVTIQVRAEGEAPRALAVAD